MELVYVSDSKSEFCRFESGWGHQLLKKANMKKINIEEVRAFIESQTPETKIYLGCDSERLRIDGDWYAD